MASAESGRLDITRRDFLSGVALGVAAASIPPLEAIAEGSAVSQSLGQDYYPPTLRGMRGSHPGSFEVMHSMTWQGAKRWPVPTAQTDDTYDLVIVGGGPSGLSAARYFLEARPEARILIIENHDDFGGHAKRNEFHVDGRLLLAGGGASLYMKPHTFPAHVQRLMHDVGLDFEALDASFDYEEFHRRTKIGMYFDEGLFGKGILARWPFALNHNYMSIYMERYGLPDDYEAMFRSYPISSESKAQLLALFTDEPAEVIPGVTAEETMVRLVAMTYDEYLRDVRGVNQEVRTLLFGLATGGGNLYSDQVPAIGAVGFDYPMPGKKALFKQLGLPVPRPPDMMGTYNKRHPDGLASFARLLVRDMIPEVAPTAIERSRQEDILTARFDYSQLDVPGRRLRIRLNGTAVDVRHTADRQYVDTTYVQGDRAFRVRSRHSILACWNMVIPHICPELSREQKEGLRYFEKMPVCLTQVALRNWRAIDRSGFGHVEVPRGFFSTFVLDNPHTIGDIRASTDPNEPIIVTAAHTPQPVGSGSSTIREQFRLRRHVMYRTPYESFEANVIKQMTDIWGPFGFDARRDIAGITVNRWPHGYTFGYMPDEPDLGLLTDPPHVAGRAQHDRISIANSDAGALTSVEVAVDQAHRAVGEQLGST